MEDSKIEEILNDNSYIIKRTVKNLIKNPSYIDDAVQEAKIKIYKSLVNKDSPKDLKSWISVISKNAAYDELRKLNKKKKMKEKLYALYQSKVSNTPLINSPEELLLNYEAINEISNVFLELDPITKKIFVLKYQNLTYEEIATILQCTVPSVKNKVYRGRKKMMDSLSGSDFNE